MLPWVAWRRLSELKHSVRGRAAAGGTFILNLPGFVWKSVVFRFQLQILAARNYLDSQPNREHITYGDREL